MRWIRVGALWAFGSVAACATALYDDIPSGNGAGGSPVGASGSNSSPTNAQSGAANTGAVSGAPSSGIAGSADTGFAGSAPISGAGSSAGGTAGTSSSVGGQGAENTGPCADPKDVTSGKSGNLGTAAACLRTKELFNTVGCSNFAGRTLKINGAAATCDQKSTFAPPIDGYNYFEISAGGLEYASIVWYTS